MTTTRSASSSTRRPAALAAVALALGLVSAADVALWRTFVDERDAIDGSVERERKLIEDNAAEGMREHLHALAADAAARAPALEADPLADDGGVIVVVDGSVVLPRRRIERAHDAGPSVIEARDLADRVVHAPDDASLEDAVREFLRHRAETGTPAAAAGAALDVAAALVAHEGSDPALVRDLLMRGRSVGAARIEPVAAQILRRRETSARDDAETAGLEQRFHALCVRAGVDDAAFTRAYAALEAAPLSLPAHLDAPVSLPGWIYLEPDAADREHRLIGVRLDVDRRRAVLADVRARAPLDTGDDIAFTETGMVRLQSPRLDALKDEAATRLRAKSALLGALTLMAGGLVAAALVDAARRRRYADLRSGFVAAVSHELRTPLASMRLLVEAMTARADDKSREKLARLGRDVDGLEFLVENILSFSRLERGRLTPRTERVSLAEIAVDAIERAKSDVADGSVAISVAVDVVRDASPRAGAVDVDVVVEADSELVGLVVANLVRNAWLHNPKRPARVDVRVGNDDAGRATVSVSDDGPGVPAVDRERIFVEFERGSRAVSRGTGLGLALCRQIARAHGGDVALASTGPSGSTFVLTLPAGVSPRP